MDYHHPYNVYPEYYCPSYGGVGSGYHSSGSFPQPHASGHLRNFNNNLMPHSAAQHHQPQQHPQHFLPSYHHQQHPSYSSSSSSSMFVPNFLVSSGTGLTPTLTPTTLANLESSFIELQQSGARDPVTQSGFVPPVVDTANSADLSQDSYDQSSSDGEWEPSSKMSRYSEGIKGIDYIVTSTGTINATPQRKYTRRNKDERLAPEEEEKRRVRRERNKMAAAKCRQRRVDHTNVLVEETDKLEEEQSKLESEIQKLQQERDQLEFVLQAHQPVCKVNKVKSEGIMSPRRDHSSAAFHAPENLSKSSNVSSSVNTHNSSSSMSSVATSRPNTLPLIKRDRARMLSMTSATGVTINTPTSGVTITPSSLFCPGLDSMMDGPTGLTPLTSMSCSSQVNHRSSDSSSENVGSPTLISL